MTSMMSNEFTAHGVVPDVIPNPPSHVAKVYYGTSHNVNLGNVLSVADTQRSPTIHFPSEKGVHYTIILADPDALSRETHEFRHFCHWIVINVPGVGGTDMVDYSKGNTIVNYMGPAPPPGTGLHRYCILIYRQHSHVDPERIKPFGVEKDMSDRKSFHMDRWMKVNFTGTQPNLLAANFYQAGNMQGDKDNNKKKDKDHHDTDKEKEEDPKTGKESSKK